MAFAAAVVPMMLLHRFQHWGMSHELMILAGAAVYLLIRFGIAALLKRYTVHRGMFHSLPAAVVFGEIAFLLASGDDVAAAGSTRPGAVVLGYLSHLVLDEIYSFEWRHGAAAEELVRHGAEALRPRPLGQSLGLRQAGAS